MRSADKHFRFVLPRYKSSGSGLAFILQSLTARGYTSYELLDNVILCPVAYGFQYMFGLEQQKHEEVNNFVLVIRNVKLLQNW